MKNVMLLSSQTYRSAIEMALPFYLIVAFFWFHYEF